MPGSLPNDAHDGDSSDGGLVAKARAGDNAEPLSITEISQLLKRAVEERFGFVRLRGELSGVKRAASGHLYCSLKDENARIDGVMWRGNAERLGFVPEDGIEVIASGKLTIYPGRSTYQIVIERLEIAGEGALLALLEKTRKRLEAEGLFAPERKRPLPFLPRVIGVVTSPTGAVIRDILHRLADRFPSRVLVWPVLVQGQGSAEQVAVALRGFGEGADDPELMFIGEAPGSEEDRTGRPFVGQAGKLLDGMIAALGLARTDVYIANVVKCRPPGNRNPAELEMAACAAFLDRQIELLRPRVIVALGLVAARRLTGTAKPMKALRRNWAAYRGVPVLATYHPAYLLRNPRDKRAVWDDLKLVGSKLKALAGTTPQG